MRKAVPTLLVLSLMGNAEDDSIVGMSMADHALMKARLSYLTYEGRQDLVTREVAVHEAALAFYWRGLDPDRRMTITEADVEYITKQRRTAIRPDER